MQMIRPDLIMYVVLDLSFPMSDVIRIIKRCQFLPSRVTARGSVTGIIKKFLAHRKIM